MLLREILQENYWDSVYVSFSGVNKEEYPVFKNPSKAELLKLVNKMNTLTNARYGARGAIYKDDLYIFSADLLHGWFVDHMAQKENKNLHQRQMTSILILKQSPYPQHGALPDFGKDRSLIKNSHLKQLISHFPDAQVFYTHGQYEIYLQI